jgi:hypothetical protein
MMKEKLDDRVITIRDVQLQDGEVVAAGTHAFVIEAMDSTEAYIVESDREDDQVLVVVYPEAGAG